MWKTFQYINKLQHSHPLANKVVLFNLKGKKLQPYSTIGRSHARRGIYQVIPGNGRRFRNLDGSCSQEDSGILIVLARSHTLAPHLVPKLHMHNCMEKTLNDRTGGQKTRIVGAHLEQDTLFRLSLFDLRQSTCYTFIKLYTFCFSFSFGPAGLPWWPSRRPP